MPIGDFLNLNRFRPYPFVDRGTFTTWDDGWFLDCQLLVCSRTGVVPGNATRAKLTRIVRSGTDVTVTIEIGTVAYEFALSSSPAGYGLTYTANASLDAGPPSSENGFGFLQLGDLSSLEDPCDLTGIAYLEPTRVRSTVRHQVNSVNIANFPNTYHNLVCDPMDCVVFPGDTGQADEPTVELSDQRGVIPFTGGQYVSVSLATAEGTVLFSPNIDPELGEALPCESASLVPVWPPAPPENAWIPPACNDVFYSFNGIRPSDNGTFVIAGGAGIKITPDPILPNRLILELNPSQLFRTVQTPECP